MPGTTQEVTIKILGDAGSAQRAFASADQSADKLGGRVGGLAVKMGALAGAGLAGGLAAVGKVGFDEVKAFEAGLAQLKAGLASTGGVSNMTVDKMEALASSIQGYSGQTDDSIVATEKLLLTFTNIKDSAGAGNDIFSQTTTIAADMAAKMGGDASGAAIQLGKALNDPVKGITALTRVGVSFSDGQKAQIKALVASGDTLGAQKIILKELNTEFGGSAKAAGETLPGKLAIMRRKFEDFSQMIVTKVLPAVIAFIGKVIEVGRAVVAWVQEKMIPAIQAFYDKVKPTLDAIGQAFTDLFTIIATIVRAGVAVISALWDTFGKTIVGYVQGAVKSIAEVFRGIAEVIGGIIKIIAGVLTGDWGKAWDGIKQVVQGAVDIIKGLFDGIKAAFSAIWSGMGAIVSAIFDAIIGTVRGAINVLIDIINGAIKGYNAIPLAPNIPLIPRLGGGGPASDKLGKGFAGDVDSRPGSGSAFTARGRPDGMTVVVNVAGSVHSKESLAREVQFALARVGQRNGGAIFT